MFAFSIHDKLPLLCCLSTLFHKRASVFITKEESKHRLSQAVKHANNADLTHGAQCVMKIFTRSLMPDPRKK